MYKIIILLYKILIGFVYLIRTYLIRFNLIHAFFSMLRNTEDELQHVSGIE